MPEHLSQPLPHLSLRTTPENIPYSGDGRGTKKIFERQDRTGHAALLTSELEKVADTFKATLEWQNQNGLGSDFGLILNIESEPDHPIQFKSLEQAATKKQKGITVLNVRKKVTSAGAIDQIALFVPFGRLTTLEKKVASYSDPSQDKTKGPSHNDLLANISSIQVAALEALWMDAEPLPPKEEPVWWEVWIRRNDGEWEELFREQCAHKEIELSDQRLVLPDHVILVFQARREQLENSLAILNSLSEMRYARPCSIGLSELSGIEQEEWIDEALERVVLPGSDAAAVCLIDSGVNRAHPLLEPLLASSDMFTVLPSPDLSDAQGHGTPMAGLAAYGDLRGLMLSTETWSQLHRLESVKLLATGAEHQPENYGAVTQQGVYLPESASPSRSRVFCMALTRGTPHDDGRPSAWSAAIDALASGSQEEDHPKRVIIVSAGNCRSFDENYRYPDSLHEAPVEDPAQAVNAISVGAVSGRSLIEENDPESQQAAAVARIGALCPFSRTSHQWRSHWPIKPDVVAEGGNLARSQAGYLFQRDSLNPLSTSPQFALRPLCSMNATSAATALTARVGAHLCQSYPDLWEESIRGLIVHSGRWTNEMLGRGAIDPHRSGSKDAIENVLRSFGYGQVDPTRASVSFDNKVTFRFQQSLQPFKGQAGAATLHESHLIKLPWPAQVLQASPDTTVTLRVTLSTFVEPNPGSRTWEKSDKYKYAGAQLRFAVKHKDSSLDDFRASPTGADSGWALGPQLRAKSCSLVQDIWQGSAAQLSEMDYLRVFPVVGWWAKRKFPEEHEHHNCHLKRIRYSLLISVDCEETLPLYAGISAEIDRLNAAEISTDSGDISIS
ncbi:MAG: S8 family peptidase [Roseibacillus sp.]